MAMHSRFAMPTNASTPGSEMSYKEALHVFSSCGK
jgi:hypothetical protein